MEVKARRGTAHPRQLPGTERKTQLSEMSQEGFIQYHTYTGKGKKRTVVHERGGVNGKGERAIVHMSAFRTRGKGLYKWGRGRRSEIYLPGYLERRRSHRKDGGPRNKKKKGGIISTKTHKGQKTVHAEQEKLKLSKSRSQVSPRGGKADTKAVGRGENLLVEAHIW